MLTLYFQPKPEGPRTRGIAGVSPRLTWRHWDCFRQGSSKRCSREDSVLGTVPSDSPRGALALWRCGTHCGSPPAPGRRAPPRLRPSFKSPLFLPRLVDTVWGARPAGVTYRGANSELVFQQR